MTQTVDYEKYCPCVHHFGTVTSCMDVAFDLAAQNRLPIWDSVLAKMQTEGRGQMRSKWISLPGNLFAAIRLPLSEPFRSSAASVAMGALCANAMRAFLCQVLIKWPNDLVILNADTGEIVKIAGILIEEKDDVLIAGIGINLQYSPNPEQFDRTPAFQPGNLADSCPTSTFPPADKFWSILVKHIYSIYKNPVIFEQIWKKLADELLLWRGMEVCIIDGMDKICGILEGVADDGGCLLRRGGKTEKSVSGNMHLMENGRILEN